MLILSLAFVFIPGTCLAEPLYAIYGKRGAVTFTTRKPPPGANFRIVTHPTTRYSSTIKNSYRRYRLGGPIKSRYDKIITEMAEAFSLEPALVKAVVHVESAFNARAKSHKGAMGLMQLMPQTAKRFGVANAYHPVENVRGGVTYLRQLLTRYQGDTRLALAAYNAGEGAVDRYRNIPPYRETKNYVKRVLRARELYRCVINGRGNCAG